MLENPRGTPFNWVVDYVDQWDAWLIWVDPGWQFAKINYWWRMVNGRFMGYDEHENSFTMCVYNKWFNLEDLEFRQQKLKTEHGRFSRPNCQLIYLLHESSPCIIFLWPHQTCSDYPAQGPAAHAQHCLSTSMMGPCWLYGGPPPKFCSSININWSSTQKSFTIDIHWSRAQTYGL